MNKVILIGRLSRDPEMRTTSSGVSVTRFTVAVSRPMASQGQQQTDFINCVAWRRQAENIAKYCTKGSQVAVEGRIQVGSYDGADGQRRYTTDIVADTVTFLSSRNSGRVEDAGQPNFTPPLPDFETQNVPMTDVSEDPFKDFGEEIALTDDDLPF